MSDPLLLSRAEIRQLATWPVLRDAVQMALLERDAGQAPQAISAQLTMPSALLHLKAGALPHAGLLSIKANLRPEGGAATGLVVLFDTKAGEVAAILDSADITAMRTAALAVLAAQTLRGAAPITLAVLGAGPVATQVVSAFSFFLKISRLQLWSRNPAHAAALAQTSSLPATIFDNVHNACENADIVVTATPARTPFLEAPDLADGTLILALGADSPGKRELGASVLKNAWIIADQRDDVLAVGESAYLPPDQTPRIYAELGAILANRMPPPPASGAQHRFLVFDSVGSAMTDTAVCGTIMTRAQAQGLTQRFSFSGR